eukprot:1669293-Prymnesium_polylepis.1
MRVLVEVSLLEDVPREALFLIACRVSRPPDTERAGLEKALAAGRLLVARPVGDLLDRALAPVSYTHLRAHETLMNL